MNGKNVLPIAEKFIGNKYKFGAYVPKNDENYNSDFDCAEFVAYCNYQAFKILYGTEKNTLKKDDAYTGYFARDAESLGIIIPTAEAVKIKGAILLRVPKQNAIGHVVFSEGDGTTIEAHSTKKGCIKSVVTGRRWDYGILLPGIEYDKPNQAVISKPPKVVFRLKSPMMKDPYIELIQKALRKVGFYLTPKKTDQFYGPMMQNEIVRFQKVYGLVADGEIMPGGEVETKLKQLKALTI